MVDLTPSVYDCMYAHYEVKLDMDSWFVNWWILWTRNEARYDINEVLNLGFLVLEFAMDWLFLLIRHFSEHLLSSQIQSFQMRLQPQSYILNTQVVEMKSWARGSLVKHARKDFVLVKKFTLPTIDRNTDDLHTIVIAFKSYLSSVFRKIPCITCQMICMCVPI